MITVGGLVALMAILFLAPMFAALYMFCVVGTALLVIHTADLVRLRQWTFATFIKPVRIFLDAYMDMVCDLTLAAGDAVDHDRGAGDHRRADQARRPADRGRGRQSRRHGADGLHLRLHPRHRPAAGADLHPGRDRDRAADDPGRRQSVGGALLRLLPRLLRRADAADLAGRRRHGQDRQRQSSIRCSTGRCRSASPCSR